MEIKPGAFNVVPEECQFSIDARISPNYSVETLIEDLEDLISKIKREDSEFSAEAILVRGNKGFYTDPSENIVVHETVEAVARQLDLSLSSLSGYSQRMVNTIHGRGSL